MTLKTFKYVGREPLEIPSLSIRVGVKFPEGADPFGPEVKPLGTTFEVPEEYAARFESEPDLFIPSKSKSPDVSPDPTVVAAVTGPVPTIDSAPAA